MYYFWFFFLHNELNTGPLGFWGLCKKDAQFIAGCCGVDVDGTERQKRTDSIANVPSYLKTLQNAQSTQF